MLYDYSAVDDVFVIYAALSSGPGCYVLSSDMFTHHSKYLVDHNPDMHAMFARWQRLRQVAKPEEFLDMVAYKQNRLKVGKPLQVRLQAQLNDGHWHVPVEGEYMTRNRARYPYLDQWLCLPSL